MSTDIEVINNTAIEIVDSISETSVVVNSTIVEIVDSISETSVVVDVAAIGATGPAGPSAIGGYGFNIQNLKIKDVLMFGGEAWENTPQTEITDGGNF